MKLCPFRLATAFLAAAAGCAAFALPPRTIPFQGAIKTASGGAVTGAHPVTFTLYDAAGNAVGWTETQSLTPVNGLVTATLGAVTPLPAAIDFSQPYLLGVKVGSDPEMTPRVPLASVPYAFSLPYLSVDVGSGTLNVSGVMNFGTTTRQMLTLWSPVYGVGVQGGTEYFRTGSNFAWFRGGTHSDTTFDPGAGGVVEMALDASGRLGIGTTAPDSPLSLQMNGGKQWLSLKDTTGATKWHLNGYAGTAFNLAETGVADGRLYIAPGGNMGISNTSPQARLDVAGGALGATAGNETVLGDFWGTVSNAAHLRISNYRNTTGTDWTSSSLLLRRVTDVTPQAYLALNGNNVGINTTTPQAALHVSDNTYPSAIVQSSSVSGTWLNVANSSTGGTSWHLISTGSGNGEGAGKLIFAPGASNGVSAENMTLQSNGYVGIGTASPQQMLDVNGIARVHRMQVVGGSDVAEPYSVAAAGAVEPVPGMVVCIDPEHVGKMRVSTEAYDATVAGIISGANGVNPGMTLAQEGTVADGDLPVANVGRVWCYVDADAGGPVKPGDLLTTSPTPGHAMKAEWDKSHGAVLGKAMSRLDSGKGLVLVLVGLQ